MKASVPACVFTLFFILQSLFAFPAAEAGFPNLRGQAMGPAYQDVPDHHQVMTLFMGDSMVETHFLPGPNAMVRVIVQFAAEPMGARFQAGSPASKETRQKYLHALQSVHDRFLYDLRSIEGLPAKEGDTKRKEVSSGIHRAYFHVLNGVAIETRQWVVDEIRNLDYVRRVDEDVEMHAHLAESTHLVGANQVWTDYGVSGKGIVVGILDTGIDYMHPDLGGGIGLDYKVMGGYDFINDQPDPMDDNRHGTHVAGIVAANGELRGVAPDARLMGYKVLDRQGRGPSSGVIAGIEQAVLDGVHVINLSLGSAGGPESPTSVAVDHASASGVVCVVVAGNSRDGYQTIGAPGAAASAITVGSSTKEDEMATASSRGPVRTTLDIKPEILAPGSMIYAPVLQGSYDYSSGTSMASPHVAGGVALLLEWKPDLTPDQVKSMIAHGADDLGYDIWTQGAGRMNLIKTLDLHHVTISPPLVGFGPSDPREETWVSDQTISLHNHGDTETEISLTVGKAFPEGTELGFSPESFTLSPGGSREVLVTLSVRNAMVPISENPFPSYEGNILALVDDKEVSIPMVFIRSPILKLLFDEVPSRLILSSEGNQFIKSVGGDSFGNEPEWSEMLFTGLYDVWVRYANSHYVIHEDISVTDYTQLEINKQQATNRVDIQMKDREGEPFETRGFFGQLHSRPSEQFPVYNYMWRYHNHDLGTDPHFYISDFHHWQYQWLAEAVHKEPLGFYMLGDGITQCTGDVLFDYRPEELRSFAIAYEDPFGDEPEAFPSVMVATDDHSGVSRFGMEYQSYPFTITYHVHPAFQYHNNYFRFRFRPVLFKEQDHTVWFQGEESRLHQLPFFSLDEEGELYAYQLYQFAYDANYWKERLYFTEQAFSRQISPPFFNGMLRTVPDGIWLFNTEQLFLFQMRDWVAAPLAYELFSDGQQIRSGCLWEDYGIAYGGSTNLRIDLPPGSQHGMFRIFFNNYKVRDMPGSAKAEMHWTGFVGYPYLPGIRYLNILSDGVYTDHVITDNTSSLRFKIQPGRDGNVETLSEVQMAYRRHDEDKQNWHKLHVVQERVEEDGVVYVADIRHLPEGHVSLRLTAGNVLDNKLVYTLEPAFFKEGIFYLVNAGSNNPALGEVQGGGHYAPGDEVVLQAYPLDADIVFLGWYEQDTLVTKAPKYVFIATMNRDLLARFSIREYTLNYHAGDHGSIAGETTQTVPHGGSGTQVEAVPDEGCWFEEWSDGLQTARRTDTNITGDINLTAYFSVEEYTLSYEALTGGRIEGESLQTVPHGGSGTQVEAVPDERYRFARWSDGLLTAKRTDTNVTKNISVEAIFGLIFYNVNYHAGENGRIEGEASQTVSHGGNSRPVEAVPDAGHHFMEWCDGLQTARRTDTNVTGDISVTASFAINKYTIEASVNNDQYGNVSGAGEYEHGETATLAATSHDAINYLFVNWTENGTQVHAAAEYVFEVTSNRSLVAHFQNVTAVQAPEGLSAIRVFPIPARHILAIESAVPIGEIRLLDLKGRQHYAAHIHEVAYEMNVADLETGVYILQLINEEGLATFRVLLVD